MLRRKGFNTILGAGATDKNALPRMRMILDYFDYVTTTVMGSHILYAAYCGCRVSLLAHHHQLFLTGYLKYDNYVNSIPGYEDRILDGYNNLHKLRTEFPWLIVNHPKMGSGMVEWAREAIGERNRLNKRELMNILGWTPSAKVKAIAELVLEKIL
jgi:hypothetical protein